MAKKALITGITGQDGSFLADFLMFEAQVAMFPAMIQGCVPSYIDAYKDKVLAYKMPGAGGGGYLACVVEDAEEFAKEHPEAIQLTIRRNGF